MILDNHTHLSKAPRLTRIRESTQHSNAGKAHTEHPIPKCTRAVGTASVCMPLLPCLLLMCKSSSGVRAHLTVHLHALTVDGCVDTERWRRIQCIGRKCGRRIGLKRLGNRCLRTIAVVREGVTIGSIRTGMDRCKTSGGSRTTERSRGPASFFGIRATDGIHRPLGKDDTRMETGKRRKRSVAKENGPSSCRGQNCKGSELQRLSESRPLCDFRGNRNPIAGKGNGEGIGNGGKSLKEGSRNDNETENG